MLNFYNGLCYKEYFVVLFCNIIYCVLLLLYNFNPWASLCQSIGSITILSISYY